MVNLVAEETALKQSEQRYRRLFEAAKDGILILDAHTGQINDANPFLIQLLGYSLTEILGKKLWEIGPFKYALASQSAFTKLRQKKYIRYEDIPLETKHGKKVDVEFISNQYSEGEEDVIQCNIREISKRVRDGDNLRKSIDELSAQVVELQEQERQMRLLNRLNDLLLSCNSQTEAHKVIETVLSELFEGQEGCLSANHSTGQDYGVIASWGEAQLVEPGSTHGNCGGACQMKPLFDMNQQNIEVSNNSSILTDHHCLCLPLIIKDEVIAVLCQSPPEAKEVKKLQNWQQLVFWVGEGIKLALANIQIREIMQEQATHDPLTGLFNRRYLMDTLSRELTLAKRHNSKTTIAMIDIDHFKLFNDMYGHAAGDKVLCALSTILSENIRRSDIACRYGGEEFVLVLFDSSIEAGFLHLQKISALINEMKITRGNETLNKTTVSVGLVEAPSAGMNVDELLNAADKALYAAKRAGRDRIEIYRNNS
jgi:diguanylate cyclase (GGDEF)-like protein/PAS domain S-box-containing protein